MKIKFTTDYTVKNAAAREFKEGRTYDLPEPSARHFLNMGVAVAADGKKPTRTKAEKAAEPEPNEEEENEERADIQAVRTERQAPDALNRRDLLGK